MKNKIKKIFELDNIMYILSIILLAYTFIDKSFENDFFFDAKTGESILKYGVDFKDHFSFIPNLKYLYHHWLYDVFINFIYSNFSYLGVFIFFLLVFITFLLIYYSICKKITSSKLLSFIITVITIVCTKYAFQIRVQSITYILFLLELIYLEKIYKGNKKYLLLILINSILIVNLHMPLWILTIVLSLPFLAESLLCFVSEKNKKIKSLINKYINLEKPKDYKLIIYSFIILIVSGIISPHGLNTYTFFIKVLTTNGYDVLRIGELNKIQLFDCYYELFLLVIFIIGIYIKKLNVKLRDFLLLLGIFIFSLMAIRNIAYFLFIAPLVLLRSYDGKFNLNIKFINKIISKINIKLLECFVIVCVIIMMFAGIKTINLGSFDFYINNDYPVEEVKYIKENLDYKNIRLFNEFNFGSYLEFCDIPVFIDSRAEVFIKEFNGGKDIVSDYSNISKFEKHKEAFDKYNFDYALVYNGNILDSILKNDNYEEVHRSNSYVLYKIN